MNSDVVEWLMCLPCSHQARDRSQLLHFNFKFPPAKQRLFKQRQMFNTIIVFFSTRPLASSAATSPAPIIDDTYTFSLPWALDLTSESTKFEAPLISNSKSTKSCLNVRCFVGMFQLVSTMGPNALIFIAIFDPELSSESL